MYRLFIMVMTLIQLIESSQAYICFIERLFADEADGSKSTGFRFPGQGVRFAVRLPRFNTAISVEEWLPSSYRVSL